MSDANVRLPCDVLVQPATLIKRGCTMETLIECIELRRERSEKGPPLKDILSKRQADEIEALRVALRTIANDDPLDPWGIARAALTQTKEARHDA